MCELKIVEFIISVIKTASIIPIFASAKFASGAFTDVNEEIGPTVLIEPGTAIGAAALGTPNDKPPKLETNPSGPAYTPCLLYTSPSPRD